MSVNTTSMTSALQTVDYASLYRASNQSLSQSSSDGVSQQLAQLCQPATVSLNAQSASNPTTDALHQISRPAEASLDADSLQQLTTYMASKDSLDSTSQVQSSNGLLMKLFGG